MISFKQFNEKTLKCTENDGCGYCKTYAKNKKLKIKESTSDLKPNLQNNKVVL